jgi:regulator of sigma E protease
LDANVNHDAKPVGRDIATPGPIDPATGQPSHTAEVTEVKSWLRQHALSLIVMAAVIGLVLRYLDPLDTLKVAIGLGFIIFIHELGHFLAAKWCDVHVKTFSIGFGPAIPFCSYKWGETTYMLGVVPLGGYVSMVGEGTGESMPDADPDDEDSDPRSFKNKSVWNRMLIISAGVIMNVIFGMACFVAAYLHGVKEEPATIGAVFSGGAAWRADLRTDDEIVQIADRTNPTFKDLRPIIMSSAKGEQVPIVVRRDGKEFHLTVEPIRDEGTYFPQLGVSVTSRLTLYVPPKSKKDKSPHPVMPGSSAADARMPFEPGDRLVKMTDPVNPDSLSPLADFADYRRRMDVLAAKTVTFGVLRKDEPEDGKLVEIAVQPEYRASLGLRMQIGKVAAVRKGGPAERASVAAVALGDSPKGKGDRIAAVGVTDAKGKRTWFANGKTPPEAKSEDAVEPLDPMLLPLQLRRWAAQFPAEARGNLKVDLVVLRETEAEHKEQRTAFVLDYDDSYRFNHDILPLSNSPLAVDGLGLAYWVSGVVDDVAEGSPAAAAGIEANDILEAVEWDTHPPPPPWLMRLFKSSNDKWDEFEPHQWAAVEAALQSHRTEFKLRLKRREETKEVLLTSMADKNWPSTDRGLILQAESREHKAADFGDALRLGARRTGRFIIEIYMNLYSMVSGRISLKTMSGPLTIADVSYKIAGEDLWQFLLFLGVISVNLAVVNFLPIPVLDGGHFVFLVYEKITGRPLPERLFAAFMWIGLAMILSLFLFVIGRDILRLYF